MGYGNQGGLKYSVFDIETTAHPDAALYLAPPDVSTIKAPSNYKDEDKIAEYVGRAKAEAQREYEQKVGRCALDWNLSRIVALGVHNLCDGDPQVIVCRNENDERAALAAFWLMTRGRRLVGFSARAFDAPTIIQRSRLLGVIPRDLSLARYGRGDIVDLRDMLTFDDARYEALMTRSLDTFCRRFGIEVDDSHTGADVARLIADGQWDAVASHCRADLERTRLLGERIGAFVGMTNED